MDGPADSELHLRSLCLAVAELRLTGTDDLTFVALKTQHAASDVQGGAPPRMPPGRSMELVMETGVAPMPRSLPVKRLLGRELAGLCTQLVGLIDHVTPALDSDGGPCCVSVVCAEPGRDAAHLLRLLSGPEHNQQARCRAVYAHRRGALWDAGLVLLRQGRATRITNCGRWPRTGGGRASAHSWVSLREMGCPSGCR